MMTACLPNRLEDKRSFSVYANTGVTRKKRTQLEL